MKRETLLVERFGMIQEGCNDRLEHGLLHPRRHGSDAVHDNVQETDVEIWGVKVCTILVSIHLKVE